MSYGSNDSLFYIFHVFSNPLCLQPYLGVLARNDSNVRSQPQLTHVTKSDLQGANLATECLDVVLEEVSPPDLCELLEVVRDLVQLHLLQLLIHHVDSFLGLLGQLDRMFNSHQVRWDVALSICLVAVVQVHGE